MQGTPLRGRACRGSRKHVLDWTGSPSFREELVQLLAPASVQIGSDSRQMPAGHSSPREARLDSDGTSLLKGVAVWRDLADWWLVHKRGANTPNWDIAVGCTVEGRPGLVLVEAKANWPELSCAPKTQDRNASPRSLENHERIAAAIDEACVAWRTVDQGVRISRDTHYQLANRLAVGWKLATLGVPTVVVYLGFTGDTGIADVGEPFMEKSDWARAFEAYASSVNVLGLFERRHSFGAAPLWLLSRTRQVIGISPPRPSACDSFNK